MAVFLDPNKDIRKHRDRLPHWQQEGTCVFLTWRWADSLPQSVVRKYDELRDAWLGRNPKPWTTEQAIEYNRKFILPLEEKLDEHGGACVLRKPSIGRIVSDAFHFFDEDRYRLDAYIIMPHHVPLLFILHSESPLEDVVHSLKSYTAKAINRTLGRSGKLWQRGYWDRLIRSEKHLAWTRTYIAKNPEKLPPGDFHLWSANAES